MANPHQVPDAYAEEEEEMQYGHGSMTLKELDEKYPNRPRNIHKTLLFHDLLDSLFNPLKANIKGGRGGPSMVSRRKTGPHGPQHLSPHELRRNIIQRYISKWREQVGKDFYPAMRLIIPDKDRDRAMYGLKEKFIAKLIIRVLRIPKESEDGLSLSNWKLPGQGPRSAMAGDFAGRCFEVINKRPIRTKPGDMSIAQVNEKLDQLSLASKEEDQMPIFEHFYRNMSSEELMWLIRIILRQIHIGATERTVLNIFHQDAENLFNISSSLRRVCWELFDPSIRLEQGNADITLMQCFQPQLAQFQMHSFAKIVAKMNLTEDEDVFWIEEKLDGERMQLHMVEDSSVPGGKRFGFWSRNAKDYTYLYGNAFEGEDSAMTRYLNKAFHEGVRNIILDGEMISWDMQQDAPEHFGHLKTAALNEKNNPYDRGSTRPLFRIFDLLYLNDKALTRYTLRDRRKALAASVIPVERRFEIHTYTEARTTEDIERELRTVVAERSEGLVIKNPRSMYHLNQRNDDWIKVKPEYMHEFGEALDCVVIGGYYGSGRRGGNLSSFLCGLLVDKAAKNPQLCYSFFKVGGGFTAADYAAVRERTDGKWTKWDPKKPPTDFIELGGGVARQYERPDVWIKPADSVVLEVKAAEHHITDQFRMGVTLRFPRFKRMRKDKDWQQALTVDSWIELKENVEKEQHEKEFKLDEGRRAKRAKLSNSKPLVVAGSERLTKPFSGPETKLFQGLTFFVISESLEPVKKSKAELEQIIKMNGGNITQRENADAKVIIVSDRRVVKAASIEKRGKESIIRPSWIFDCVQQMGADGGATTFLLPFESKHVFHATEDIEQQVHGNTDEYGDPFARDIDAEELQEILTAMPKMEDQRTVDTKLVLALSKHPSNHNDRPNGWTFRDIVVYFYKESSKLAGRCIEFAGGQVLDLVQDGITHIVVEPDDAIAARALSSKLGGRLPRLVTSAWIEESWKAKTLLDEERFIP